MANPDLPRPLSVEDDSRVDGTAGGACAAGAAPEPVPGAGDDVVAHWAEDGDDPPWCIGAVSTG